MKNLSQFQSFDWEKFIQGKVFVVTGCSPWRDFETKEVCGTTVDTVIYQDKTPYLQKDGEQVTNRFEKVPLKIKKDVKVPIDSVVLPENPVVKIYGDYNNKLSVKASDIQILQASFQGQPQVLKRKE